MSRSKALAFACLLLLLWSNPASSGHRRSLIPVTAGSVDDTGGKPASSSASDATHPYFRMVCGLPCETEAAASGPSNFRARFVVPFIPLPIYLTGRFAIHSFEAVPIWWSQYNPPDWTASGGLELPLAPGMNLWAEVSHVTSTDKIGCASACLISSPNASNVAMDMVRIGFVIRN